MNKVAKPKYMKWLEEPGKMQTSETLKRTSTLLGKAGAPTSGVGNKFGMIGTYFDGPNSSSMTGVARKALKGIVNGAKSASDLEYYEDMVEKKAQYTEMIYDYAYNMEKEAISYNAFKQKIRDKMIDAFVKKDVAFSQIGNKGDNIIKKVVPKARLPEGFSKDLLDKAVNVAVLGKPEF
jgi:hypothetical protein